MGEFFGSNLKEAYLTLKGLFTKGTNTFPNEYIPGKGEPPPRETDYFIREREEGSHLAIDHDDYASPDALDILNQTPINTHNFNSIIRRNPDGTNDVVFRWSVNRWIKHIVRDIDTLYWSNPYT